MKNNMFQSAFTASVRIFILTGFLVNLYSHINDRNILLLQAEAGSKSSKASSKTTVIAIDGGGGGGKPHPMPVPWPIVHCHHHHHHLKYVPKPVLVHHWVKKYNSFDVEASNQHLDLPLETHAKESKLELGEEEFQPSIMSTDSKFPMSGSNLVSSLSSVFDENPALHTNKYPTLESNKSPALLANNIKKELKKLQLENGNNKILKSKDLNKLALSISENIKKKQATDADLLGSSKHITLAARNKTDTVDGSDGIDENWTKLAAKQLIPDPSSTKPNYYKYSTIGKPNHPFDEAHDQLRDESQKLQVSNKNDIEFLSNLERANVQEQSEAARLFERFELDQAKRIRALNSVNQLVFQPSVSHQVNPLIRHGSSRYLLNPVVNARMATTASESRTIDQMTMLANQLAQMEAKKLISKHQKFTNKNITQHTKEESPGLLKIGANLFSRFSSPLKNHRDKRRTSSIPSYSLNYFIPPLTIKTVPGTSSRSLYSPAQFHRNSIKTERASASPRLIMKHNVPYENIEQFSAQASNTVNKVVELYPVTNSTTKSEAARIQDTLPVKIKFGQQVAAAKNNGINKWNGDIERRQRQSLMSVLDTTTMSPDQESKFYSEQREHLSNVQQKLSSGQLDDSQLMNGAAISNPKANMTIKTYKPLSSNVHNSVAELSEPLPLNLAQDSTNTNDIESPIGKPFVAPTSGDGLLYKNFLDMEAWEQQRHLRNIDQDYIPTGQLNNNRLPSEGSRMNSVRGGNDQVYQSSQNVQGFADQLYQHPMHSYLEFPFTPQQWSMNALKSMNEGSESDSSPDLSGFSPDQIKELSSNSSNEAPLIESLSTSDGDKSKFMEMPLDSKYNHIYDQQDSNLMSLDGSNQHQNQLYEMIGSNRQHPYTMFALGSRQIPLDTSFKASYSPLMEQQSMYGPAYSPMLSPMMAVPSTSSSGFSNQKISGGPKLSAGGQTSNRIRGGKKTVGNSLLNSNTNQVDPMETATNDMNQLRQFRGALSQNVNQANNITAMSRLSQQLRDQMRTLQGRLPSMPNIPNIPQPPQLPNIPMPPPGMMQMAGLALPFAMARANRIRNQQVNAAANGGGTTAGQRLLQSASTITSRLFRPRRRPTSTPGSSSVTRVPNPRRRLSGIIQTMVDMRHRRPMSTSGSSTGKLKPKIDIIKERGKTKRNGRSVGWPMRLNQTSSSMIYPGSLLATDTNGELNSYSSMTSPVDILTRQIKDRTTEKKQRGRLKPYVPVEYTYGLDTKQTSSSKSRPMNTQMNHYELIQNPPALNLDPSHAAEAIPVPVPMVANHINLLLFTAQNVTENLMNPKSLEMALPSIVNEPSDPPSQKVSQEEVGSGQEVPTNEQSAQNYPSQDDQAQVEQEKQDLNQKDAVIEQPDGQQSNFGDPTQDNGDQNQDQAPPPVEDILKKPEAEVTNQQTQSPSTFSSMFVRPEREEKFKPIDDVKQQVAQRPFVLTTITKTTTTSTTTPPAPTGQATNSLVRLREGKSKRSTTRPLEEADWWRTSLKKQKTGGAITATTTTTTTSELPPSTTDTQTTRELQTIATRAKSGIDEASSADYVRAIKLVRGVAYPWPPPTKSSKILTGDMLDAHAPLTQTTALVST